MNEYNVYALDSNIISYFLKKTGGIDRAIQTSVAHGHSITIIPIAYYEVKRGLIANNALKHIKIFENLCTHFGVGNFNKSVLSVAAEIYVALRAKGKLIEDADILVAAYCVANNFTLVTHNSKHFCNIDGLNIVDWVEE